MTTFAVVRERGPAWDVSRTMREQDAWDEHAAFMDSLAADGFIVFGGPLGDGTRVLFAIEAASKSAVRTTLAADPWSAMDLLVIASIETWTVLLEHAPHAT
jgi:uncharacterized protein YciI